MSTHPETYFNKLKLKIKLVKILRKAPEIWLHPNIGLYHIGVIVPVYL
jgi:hypothetical protein